MNRILLAIKHDLKVAMTEEVQLRKGGITSGSKFENAIAHKTVSRAIISMIPELGIKAKDTTVDHIYKLLNKFAKQQKERQLYIDKHLTKADVADISASDLKKLVKKKILELGDKLYTLNILVAESYLPIGATEEEIKEYIIDNIDLTQFKNKMQAMGPLMKAFPGCNGNFIKGILLKM